LGFGAQAPFWQVSQALQLRQRPVAGSAHTWQDPHLDTQACWTGSQSSQPVHSGMQRPPQHVHPGPQEVAVQAHAPVFGSHG
jgi:hypothetical protein